MAWKQTLKELWQKEKWYWLAAVVLGVLLSLLFAAHWTEGYADMIQKGIGGKVVRFHVLANSDSEADQALKLAVRDRVLQEYGDLLETCTSKEETLAALKNAQQEISETAEAEVLAQGYTYPVRVSLVREEFPFKKYGDLIFPAGVYDALRIEIGEAKGKNWWCVLYPGLCRSACGSYAQPAENDLVCGEYILRFKVVEWVQQRTARREDVVLLG